jgi:nucleotide-binding universal stress UspA family protein
MSNTIVVGTDGSDTATEAVRHAADLAAKTSAQLRIVSAFSRKTTSEQRREDIGDAPSDVEHSTEAISYVEEDLNRAREIAEGVGVTEIELHPIEGEPADVLIGVAEKYDADLIVVGNKGMTGAKRFLLGSVPNQISHHAPCSVFIAKTT